MTRETKIGLVVACSFLCLVGIVVASKWRGGDDPSEEQTVNIAAAKLTQNAADPKGKDGASKSEKPLTLSALPVPDPKQGEASKGDQKPDSAAPASFNFDVSAAPPPLPIMPPPLTEDEKKKELERLVREEKKQPQPGPFAVPVPIQFNDSKPLVSGPAPVGLGPLPIPPPVGGAFATDPISGPKPIVLTPTEPLKSGNVGTAEVPPALTPPAKAPAPLSPPGVSPFAPLAQDPAPPIGPKELPLEPGPHKGTNPIIPPIVVGGNKPSLPIVRDTNVPTYDCQQGENTFTILSQRLYGADKYADALLAYNRAHSGAVKNGSNFNFNQPILNPGQQVLHPAKEELERDYRFLIREASGSPIQSPNLSPPVKLAIPTPLNTGIATSAIPPSIGAGRSYVVQNASGESILDIAERMLGNRSRWTDIYRLNQSNPVVQPQFRIPAGTELKMPAN